MSWMVGCGWVGWVGVGGLDDWVRVGWMGGCGCEWVGCGWVKLCVWVG